MARRDYSEDLLIQAPTAELLEQTLGWQAVFAQDDEDFGEDSLLGRSKDTEVVLRREVLAALQRLNPGLPPEAYSQALAQVLRFESLVHDLGRSGFARHGECVEYSWRNDCAMPKSRGGPLNRCAISSAPIMRRQPTPSSGLTSSTTWRTDGGWWGARWG